MYVFCFSAIVALEPNQKGFIVWHTASMYMERKYYTLLAIDREIETYIIFVYLYAFGYHQEKLPES